MGKRTTIVLASAGAVAAVLQRRRTMRQETTPPLALRLLSEGAMAVDRRYGWHRLPRPLGVLVLFGVRNVLREKNLFDTNAQPAVDLPPLGPPDPAHRRGRTIDGSHNDLDEPRMGMVGSRFGRNVPIEHTFQEPQPEIMTPSPRLVSRKLLTRHEFQPAPTANALVATWLQFMIRDGFSHGTSPTEKPWEVPLEDDDPWPDRPMRIMRTPPDPTRPPGSELPPTYVNTQTHWWDLSQIYGSSEVEQQMVRSGEDGKLRIDPDGRVPYPTDPRFNPARVPGFWLGLGMMQTLFVQEHNAICDRLRADYPTWSDDRLFGTARLVNAAVVGKIHSVDWSPTVVGHPTSRMALHADWWGLAGKKVHNLLGRISDNRLISGTLGSETEHFGVPFTITEEFVAIYRMHQMVPDTYSIRSADDDGLIQESRLRELTGQWGLDALRKLEMRDLLYSFGTMNAGLVTLHNYPRDLQEFERPDGKLMDLASTEVLRTRELGLPRYNEFRRLLHLAPATDFEALTDNPLWAQEMREVYHGDIEQLDLLIGMYAERRPPGFAFSDTAFHLFVLTAPRRLSSDRFYTRDCRPEVYTPAGMDWIEHTSMGTILLRHYPELHTAMGSPKNAFAPWARSTR